MARRMYSGTAAATRLNGAINATTTSIVVVDGSTYPDGSTGSFFICVDRGLSTEEKVLCSARTGNTITAAGRGGATNGDGTSAASHADQAVVEHCYTATDANEANRHVNTTTDDDHSQYLNTTRHDVTARHAFGAALGNPGAASTSAIGDAAAAGSGTVPAKSDHTHGRESAATLSAAVNHSATQNLSNDDHTQYLNTTRHDTTARHGSAVVDHGSIGGLGDDDHSQYVLASGARAVTGFLSVGGAAAAGQPEFKIKRLNGTLNGSGDQTVAHGISTVNGSILFAQAFFKGNSGEMVEMRQAGIPISADGTNISVFSDHVDAPNRSYYVTIFYTDNAVVTW